MKEGKDAISSPEVIKENTREEGRVFDDYWFIINRLMGGGGTELTLESN